MRSTNGFFFFGCDPGVWSKPEAGTDDYWLQNHFRHTQNKSKITQK